MFELTHLRCFVVLAEELHFGRAATRLHMTQPPLSRHIQVLEQAVKVKLFERSSRSVKLTAAGRAFLIEASRIVKMVDRATATAKAAADGLEGLFTLGFTAASGYSCLHWLLGGLQIAVPKVRIVLKEMVSTEQRESLLTGHIDLGLLRPPVPRPEVESIPLLRERFVICSHEGTPQAQRPQRLGDFDSLPVIMYAPDSARYFHDLLNNLFAGAGVQPRYVQHLVQIHSIMMLVAAGHGFALVPESATRLQPRGVTFSVLEDVDPIIELHAAWNRENANPALKVVLQCIGRLVESGLPAVQQVPA
ncbi:MAG: LysR family transcriptional regulator [Gammaproteobacteria bacterium]|nr:LysR family transcriptional regulator [Gammaproteobacteria bacterium]